MAIRGRFAKPLDSSECEGSNPSLHAIYIYASGVMVAYAAPTRLVRVRIFGGVPEECQSMERV